MEPALGEMMVKFGGVVSDTDEKVTVCWVVPAFPARSVAPTGISFLPTASVKGHENALPFTAAGTGTFSAVVPSGVPEPGAVAMLAGLGVTGSLFAFRRLRRRR